MSERSPLQESASDSEVAAHWRAENDRLRAALERIGEMTGAKANGKDARAMAELARKTLAND